MLSPLEALLSVAAICIVLIPALLVFPVIKNNNLSVSGTKCSLALARLLLSLWSDVGLFATVTPTEMLIPTVDVSRALTSRTL